MHFFLLACCSVWRQCTIRTLVIFPESSRQDDLYSSFLVLTFLQLLAVDFLPTMVLVWFCETFLFLSVAGVLICAVCVCVWVDGFV